MTIAHFKSEHLKRTKYKCDICGKVDFWEDGWTRYSSHLIDDERPQDGIDACSFSCWEAAKQKIETGEFKLPELRIRGLNVSIKKHRVGY